VPRGNTLVGSLRLVSPAFKAGGAIPRAYTCDGSDTSLPLRIAGVPRGTVELVLVMRDPDAPSGNFIHWALAGINPSTTAFPAGGVPSLVAPGRNSFGTLGYRGPCPPAGDKPHHYVLTLIALSAPSGLRAGFNPDQLRTGALAIATLIGTYRRG
jgi:Raf kinase inhibitor-like YbhB/YbcL family protein